jgi:hypothetical protein
MGAAQPAHDRPRPAAPVPRARRQPPRRPRRRGRLLAAGLALVLVAALVPQALADPDDGGMPSSESFEAGTFQAPEAVDTGGDENSVPVAPAQDREVADAGDLPTGGEEQPRQDPAPPVVAELRPEDQQRDGQPDLAVTDAPGATGQGPGGGGDQNAAATGGVGEGQRAGHGEAGRPGHGGTRPDGGWRPRRVCQRLLNAGPELWGLHGRGGRRLVGQPSV